jgi:hypothetical protein
MVVSYGALTPRMDDMEGVFNFFAQQLTLIDQGLVMIEYPDLKGRIHFPLNFDGNNATQGREYKTYDRTGLAQFGLGFPRVGINATARYASVKSITDSFEYNFQEIRNAQAAGLGLDSALAEVAHRAIAELEDYAIYMGDPDTNTPGAFTHPNFPIQLAPYAISDASTATQIFGVFNQLFNQFPIATRGKRKANACIMSTRSLTYLATKPWNETNSSNISLLDMIKQAHPQVEFDDCNWSPGAGDQGEDVIFAYERAPRNMHVWIPQDFETLETVGPTPEYSWVTGCHERFGGLQVRFAFGAVMYEKP